MRASIGFGFGFWLFLAGLRTVTAEDALNEYTVALPADLPADHTLCQVSIDHADLGLASGTMLDEADQPLADRGAPESARTDQAFRAWVADRGAQPR